MNITVQPAGSLAPIAAPRGRLFRKYLVSFVAIVSVALIAKGTIDGWFSFQEQKRLLIGIQLRGPAKPHTALLGGDPPSPGPLADQVALEFRDAGEHRHDHAAGG